MKNCGLLLLVVGFVVVRAQATRITRDKEAQALCDKYEMMCKSGKVCAVQHFDWPQNITIPVCIPPYFVPVRNAFCQLPPDTGRCHARYIRWHFNIHSQECSHFQYGGCEGNKNNFMSKQNCEEACMGTPAIRLYDNGHSALVSPPIYEPPAVEPASTYDRFQVTRHRINRVQVEANNRTRRRLDKEKEKEKDRKRKEREKRRERKRLRRQRKKEQKRQQKREQRLKEKKERKRKPSENDVLNETQKDDENAMVKRDNKNKDTNEVVKETKDMLIDLETELEKRRQERRKERKRLKRRERRKRRLLKEKMRLERLAKESKVSDNAEEDTESEQAELVRKPDSAVSAKMFSILDQGKEYKHQKNSIVKST